MLHQTLLSGWSLKMPAGVLFFWLGLGEMNREMNFQWLIRGQ